MKRRLLKLGLLILAGAIVNIVVAWGFSVLGVDVHQTFGPGSFVFEIRDPGASWRFTSEGEGRLFGVLTDWRGWPIHSLSSDTHVDLNGAVPIDRPSFGIVASKSQLAWSTLTFPKVLPFRPIWPGFAINTLFYAAILCLLFAAPAFVRRRIRLKRGLCPACAYPIGASETCTECGRRLIANT
ncbi:MAG: hypothetical protein L0Y44_16765 [Phycisphaerales bacterium]|nr:hypothetical protein [Phycisphaerales bacterium]MCI0632297.1 hypothetical protein [Phycisphaerales bacterium]MCI0675039.1 hypothetical protein [Phycisphaerales bacterium]